MPDDILPVTQPAATLSTANRKMDGEVEIWDDASALKILQENVERCDSYMNLNQWAAGWQQSVILYQSPMQAGVFKNGVLRASVPSFTLSDHLSAIIPKVVGGLFYEDPPFLLRPEPNTTQETVRAKTALFSYQLREMCFRTQCERLIEQMAMFGTCIAKYGWKDETVKVKKYIPRAPKLQIPTADGSISLDTDESDQFDIKYEDKHTCGPWLKFCDIRTVLVDPGTRVGDIRESSRVTHREFVNFDDLECLRGKEGYDIPSREALLKFFMRTKGTKGGRDNITMTLPEGMRGWLQVAMPRHAPTGDPLLDGMEMLESWTKNQVTVALVYGTDYVLIRNEAHDNDGVPFLSANWRNIPDAFWGQGLGLLVGTEQMVEQGIRCLAFDLLAYGLQPTVVRKSGFNAPTQQIVMGTQKIIEVQDDVDKAYKFLEMPSVPTEAWQAIANSQAKAQASSGANENFTLGTASMGQRSTGSRSATGASAVIQAIASRLDGPMERFQYQIFIPWLEKMDELNNDFLPASVLREVLGDKLTPDQLKAVDHIAFRSAKMSFEVLAGAHLGPKREMAQFLPFILQLINNPTFESMIQSAGYTFDAVAVFRAFSDAAGWKFSQSFLRPMTPQEQQAAQMNSPAALQQQKAQQAQQLENQKFQQEQTLQQDDAMGRAGALVLRDMTKQILMPPGSGAPEIGE